MLLLKKYIRKNNLENEFNLRNAFYKVTIISEFLDFHVQKQDVGMIITYKLKELRGLFSHS